jgi:3',5'-cyclic AMP phosphodiesterase CpdA
VIAMMDRRVFLGSAAASVGAVASQRDDDDAARRARPRLRVAQLSDTHVYRERDCPARMRSFLATFAATIASADLVLHTGDVIMDALDTDRDGVARQWALWRELARDLPSSTMYAIGNHDVWAAPSASDALYGKKWAVDALRLPGRFYAFTKGGWRFIVLDSTHPTERGWYTARLDEEQSAWLAGELEKTDPATPIAIVSHIPLLSAAVVQWSASEGERWTVSNGLMHADSHAIQALLRRHANVKVCLSGHLHLLDQVVYDGITYLGCGAVSGDWWKDQTFHQTPCGFATLDLFPDGSFERRYHPYRWPR